MENTFNLTKIVFKDESGTSILETGGADIATATDSIEGIVLLSDSEGAQNASSGGMAVTPVALKNVKNTLSQTDSNLQSEINKIKDTIETELGVDVDNPESGGSIGSGSGVSETQKGTVKLSDSLTSPELDAASGETAATPKAVYLLKQEIGELSELNTEAKDNLVNAINEIKNTAGSIPSIKIETPTIYGETTDVSDKQIFTSSEFNIIGALGIHDKTDWVLYKADNPHVEVWSSKDDTVNKTTCPSLSSALEEQTSYILKVRYHESYYDIWSDYGSISFTTIDAFILNFYDIGVPGQKGFGVGLCDPNDGYSKLGLSKTDGYSDVNHDNYGNYEHERGIFVFIPAFCYKFETNEKSPSYFTVKSFKDFDFNETTANEQGYILHQAFIDGEEIKKGFFISKYLISKGTKSIKNGIPISLYKIVNNNYFAEVSSDKEDNGGKGNVKDALTLSKNFGEQYNCASSYMYSALSMLSLVHGWNSTSTDACAWYDETGTTNYPKGCNNDALGDYDDEEILYQNGDKYASTKPNTGSANNFAKTTHNGQNCGVCDLNGCMNQVTVGTLYYEDSFYTIKSTTKFKDFNVNNIQSTSLYTKALTIKIESFFGNDGTNNSFYTDMNGVNRSLCGIIPAVQGYFEEVPNEFGHDIVYAEYQKLSSPKHYGCVLFCGPYSPSFGIRTNQHGIWCRSFSSMGSGNDWNKSLASLGFRSAAYLDEVE